MVTDPDRKDLYLNLKRLASIPCTVNEVARLLGMADRSELQQFLNTDPEAWEIWSAGRRRLFITTRDSLTKAAAKGSRYAMGILARILEDGQRLKAIGLDPDQITTQELARLAGRSRQTIYYWSSKKDLPRNQDGTYCLVGFLRWFEDFAIKKGEKQAKRPSQKMHKLKEEHLRTQLDKLRGKLFTLTEVRSLVQYLGLDTKQRHKLSDYIKSRQRLSTESSDQTREGKRGVGG